MAATEPRAPAAPGRTAGTPLNHDRDRSGTVRLTGFSPPLGLSGGYRAARPPTLLGFLA
jgi:hypothetical protein